MCFFMLQATTVYWPNLNLCALKIVLRFPNTLQVHIIVLWIPDVFYKCTKLSSRFPWWTENAQDCPKYILCALQVHKGVMSLFQMLSRSQQGAMSVNDTDHSWTHPLLRYYSHTFPLDQSCQRWLRPDKWSNTSGQVLRPLLLCTICCAS